MSVSIPAGTTVIDRPTEVGFVARHAMVWVPRLLPRRRSDRRRRQVRQLSATATAKGRLRRHRQQRPRQPPEVGRPTPRTPRSHLRLHRHQGRQGRRVHPRRRPDHQGHRKPVELGPGVQRLRPPTLRQRPRRHRLPPRPRSSARTGGLTWNAATRPTGGVSRKISSWDVSAIKAGLITAAGLPAPYPSPCRYASR